MLKQRFLASAVALVAIATLPLACSAQDGPLRYHEGQHYKSVPQPEALGDSDTIQVAEVFWYGCNHCYRFDPMVHDWEADLAGDVEFIRVPTSLGRDQALNHSRAYYTAEALDVLDKVHPAIFKAIHQEGKSLYSKEQIAEVFEDQGVDREKFDATFNSFAVENKVRRAEKLVRQFGVTGVPAIVVNGRYMTSGRYAGGFDDMLKVTDFLITKER
ncbi:thiol:disulfide interchange protein DsbA/DsbL [uncultured Abyssibacter sp.]|uniref:thiol:disulfide interchange protein DsbA/DsbL n=1 Tax=uncultured Abyssibacter sp. TaxID=2320202 RepID=UPI0032B143A5